MDTKEINSTGPIDPNSEAWRAWESDSMTNPNPTNPYAFCYGYKFAMKKSREQGEVQEKEITALKSKLEEREKEIARLQKVMSDFYNESINGI